MIDIPPGIDRLLAASPPIDASVKKTLVDFDAWISESPLAFFPEYTDHGPRHISSVLATAERLMTPQSLEILGPEDAGALVVAVLLHDCAMHLTNDGFRRLVSGTTPLTPIAELGDGTWPALWDAYLAEAVRFSPVHNTRLYGDPSPVAPPSLHDWNWNKKQELMAGEFIRRHHARLAHQIALAGFPGVDGQTLRLDTGLQRHADVIGLVARSHGMAMRPCLDYLEEVHENRIDPGGVRALFLMVLLRVADYLQIEAGRAPITRIRMQALRSQLSIHEWGKHHAVPQVTLDEHDPEARKAIIRADEVTSISTYRSLLALTRDIQSEIDGSWAILGEVYGRIADRTQPLSSLGLTIRRLRTNLESPTFLNRLRFHPVAVAFQSADARLFELLIEPLYGSDTEAGVRELVQNGIDAVRELLEYCTGHRIDAATLNRAAQRADVVVNVEDLDGRPALIVRDRGIGMTLEIVRDYYLKVGASYRNSAAWKAEFADADQQSTILRTGYFGVGALAAFLLGDEVRIVTRHVTAGEGLALTASLRADDIQVDRVAQCPIGTTITIPLRAELVDRGWRPRLRYSLAQPSIDVCGEAASATYPDIDSAGTDEWPRLDPPGGPIVFWRRPDSSTLYVERVTHNGFMIEHGDQPLRKVWSDRWYGLQVSLPPLHILDREGNRAKPYLNLARSEFRPERFEPLAQITMEVLKDYLAFLFATMPDSPDDVVSAERQDYRYVSMQVSQLNLGFRSESERCLPIVYTRDGIVPLDAGILRELDISSLLLVDRGPIADLLMIDDRWGVVLLEPESRGVQSLMYPQGLAEHPPAGLNVVGAAAYARPISKPPSKRADIVESMKTGGPAPTSRQLKALAAWLASASSTTGDPRGSSLLVRWALGDPAEADNDDISTLRRSLGGRDADSRPILREAWHRYILDQAIPYDRTAREELIQSADAAPLGRYIDTWRRIRHVPS